MRSNHQFFRKTPSNLDINPPSITIATQPQNATATPAYQVVTAGPPVVPVLTVSPAMTDGTTSINLNNITTLSNFAPGIEYTLTSNVNFSARVYTIGAKGGSGLRGGNDAQPGGDGGYIQGTVTFNQGQSYKVRVGGAGANSRSLNNPAATFTGAGLKSETTGGSYPGAQGGGYTGLFLSSVTQANTILIASGGGGGSEDPATGGNGGIPNGADGSNGSRAGKGATQSGGGAGVGGAQSGTALKGGNGAGEGAGGGGGYFGGGGGGNEGAGAAGGGSSYFNPTLVTGASYSSTDSAGGGILSNKNGSFKLTVVSVSPGQNTDPITTNFSETPGVFNITSSFTSGTGSLSYQWYRVGVGAISGATGTSLTVSNVDSLNGAQYYCEVRFNRSGRTANALNSPLTSNTATLTVRPVITITQQPTSQSSSTTSSAIFAVAAAVSNGTNSQLSYRWKLNGIELNNGANTITGGSFNASGVTTPTLTISGTTLGQYEIAVDVSHPSAVNSPLQSNEINYTVTAPRNSINYEFVSETSAILAQTGQVDLGSGPLTLTYDSTRPVQILYSPEKDLRVRAEIFGAKGANNGGEGGYSLIEFVMQRNTEYVVTRDDAGQAIFIYRKASLMAAVGSGTPGRANQPGGGVGLSVTRNPQNAAEIVQGGLTNSLGNYVDSMFSGIGIAYQCPIGNYYRNISPCSDIPGATQFRSRDGQIVTNTASIQRGYKASNPTEHLRNTSNQGSGYGAIGGSYAGDNDPSSGGSGYTDNSFTIINRTVGGSNEPFGKVVLTIAETTSAVTQIYGTVNEDQTLTLTAPAGKIFTKVVFASYGTPTGTYPNFAISGCHSTVSTEKVAAAFIGRSTGSIAASNSVFGDPCNNVVKRLYVILECA
jgi:hypothetical protein